MGGYAPPKTVPALSFVNCAVNDKIINLPQNVLILNEILVLLSVKSHTHMYHSIIVV